MKKTIIYLGIVILLISIFVGCIEIQEERPTYITEGKLVDVTYSSVSGDDILTV